MTNTLAEENYLKALFHISIHSGEVSVNELSKQLNIKMPTVNSMMKKLKEKEYVIYESYKPIRLTNKGLKTAAIIVRKHRLAEMFLVEKMGLGWEEVHDIAEQLEHINAPIFFDKMDELLAFPTHDPHGSPIPDKNGNITWNDYTKLSDSKPGATVTIAAVTHSSDEFLKYLTTRNISLDTQLKIQSVEPFDGSMEVLLSSKKKITLSKVVCDKILVKIE